MPVLDGYEATRQLRKWGYTGPDRCADGDRLCQDRQRCIEAGCDDYLTKPIDRRRLLKLVAEYLSARNANRSLSPDYAVTVGGPAQDLSS